MLPPLPPLISRAHQLPSPHLPVGSAQEREYPIDISYSNRLCWVARPTGTGDVFLWPAIYYQDWDEACNDSKSTFKEQRALIDHLYRRRNNSENEQTVTVKLILPKEEDVEFLTVDPSEPQSVFTEFVGSAFAHVMCQYTDPAFFDKHGQLDWFLPFQKAIDLAVGHLQNVETETIRYDAGVKSLAGYHRSQRDFGNRKQQYVADSPQENFAMEEGDDNPCTPPGTFTPNDGEASFVSRSPDTPRHSNRNPKGSRALFSPEAKKPRKLARSNKKATEMRKPSTKSTPKTPSSTVGTRLKNSKAPSYHKVTPCRTSLGRRTRLTAKKSGDRTPISTKTNASKQAPDDFYYFINLIDLLQVHFQWQYRFAKNSLHTYEYRGPCVDDHEKEIVMNEEHEVVEYCRRHNLKEKIESLAERHEGIVSP